MRGNHCFEPLAETEKTVTTDTSIQDLELPETLTATVRTSPDFNMQADTNQQTVSDRVYGSEYEEILVDIPVTWISQPEYDMDTEGEYVFTPVVEGYTVKAELPVITVTVEAARMMTPLAAASGTVTTEAELNTAIANVAEGGTIVLGDNINLSGTVTIASGNDKNFTLDLNGKTLNIGYYIAIEHKGSGTLTIKDTASGGKITSKKAPGGTVSLEGGSLVVASGTVENTDNAGSGIVNIGAGNVSIQGGTLSAGHAAIYNGSTGNVSVSGGTISATGTDSIGIYDFFGRIAIPSGSPVIQGDGQAMNTAPNLTGYTKVKVTASTNYDGTPLVAYDPTKMVTYKYLTFETGTDAMVTNLNLTSKLTAPEIGGIPATTISEDTQYTGTVTWSNSPSTFLGGTAYTATVTLTAKEGYTFADVAQNALSYSGATSVTNAAGSGNTLTVTIAFPATTARALQSIAITKAPDRTAYKYGDAFSIAGMVVKATYNDGTEDANFTGYKVDKTGALTMSDTTITLTANGTSITTTQIITVNKADGPVAPTGLDVVAPTEAGGTNGKITGTGTQIQTVAAVVAPATAEAPQTTIALSSSPHLRPTGLILPHKAR